MDKQEILKEIGKNTKIIEKYLNKAKDLQAYAEVLMKENEDLISAFKNG